MDFHIKSLLGHRAKIKDLPKVAELVATRLRGWFDQQLLSGCTLPFPPIFTLSEQQHNANGEERVRIREQAVLITKKNL